VCEWFLSPYPLPGRLSDCADGCCAGGAAGGGAVTGAAIWTTGPLGAAGAGSLGCGVGAAGVGAAGVGAGGVGVTGGVGAGSFGGATGGVALGGRGARTFDVAGAGDGGTTIRTGLVETETEFARVFRTTFGSRGLARGSPAATTTTGGSALRAPETNGSTNGTDAGVSASDHSRADPTTHASATNTDASRRLPTIV